MIRKAELEDLKDVYELVVKGIEELEDPLYYVEYDKLMRTLIKSFEVAPCFIAVKDDKVVGCASLDMTYIPWSRKQLLTSNMVYVLPEYRSFGIIKELYKEINKTAKLLGVRYIDNFMGSDKVDARARLAKSNDLNVIGIVIGG